MKGGASVFIACFRLNLVSMLLQGHKEERYGVIARERERNGEREMETEREREMET